MVHSEKSEQTHDFGGVVEGLSFAQKAGRQWFKWRGLSPVPFFLLMCVLRPDFNWESWSFLWAVAGVFLAEGLRFWSVGIAGSATRTREDHIPELVHSGPFRIVRNPIYIANIALYTFCGVLFGFVSLTVVFFIYSCIQYCLIVVYEETLLERTFGEKYLSYKEKVPRWLGRITPGMESSQHDFNFMKALRSERSTLLAIHLLFLLCVARQFFL